jgi:hypothetical protein
MASVSTDEISETLNHVPSPTNKHRLDNPEIYQSYAGTTYSSQYTSLGVRINSLREMEASSPKTMSILVLGDSFMQGYDDVHTVPQQLWEQQLSFGLDTTVHNAALSSYSPLIYIVQAKKLIPKLNPDFILVNIDETDLGDDYIRYRDLAVRDTSGHVIAVKSSFLHREFISGLVDIKKEPLYLVRLIRKLHFTYAYMPKLSADNQRPHPLIYSWETDEGAKGRFKLEIQFFEQNVDELLKTIIGLMKDKKKLMVVYHPHLQHIVPNEEGKLWNDFVSSTLAQVCEHNGVAFF